MTTIGFSLLSTGISSFASSAVYPTGAWQNLLVAVITLAACLVYNSLAKGFWKQLYVLFGLIVGYIVSLFFGMVDFASMKETVSELGIIALPKLFAFTPKFDLGAIISVTLVFLVSAAETIGDTSAVCTGGLGRDITEKEVSGSLACDGFISAVSGGVFGCPPITSFSQNVGLYADGEEKKTVNVSFQFIKDGRMAQITVPLLTIVPIPYIAINSIDINFKANISASAASTETENSSSSVDTSVSASARCFWARGSMNASYSSKKDSSATRDSKYSVEYTMDVAVHAGQDSMPAGMAKVLEMLNNSISVVSPEGFLDVQHAIQDDGTVKLITSYKNREGLFDPEAITLRIGEATEIFENGAGNEARIVKTDSGKEYTLSREDARNCTVSAGELKRKVAVGA